MLTGYGLCLRYIQHCSYKSILEERKKQNQREYLCFK